MPSQLCYNCTVLHGRARCNCRANKPLTRAELDILGYSNFNPPHPIVIVFAIVATGIAAFKLGKDVN